MVRSTLLIAVSLAAMMVWLWNTSPEEPPVEPISRSSGPHASAVDGRNPLTPGSVGLPEVRARPAATRMQPDSSLGKSPHAPSSESDEQAGSSDALVLALLEQIADRDDEIESLRREVESLEYDVESLVIQLRGSEIEKAYGALIDERLPDLFGQDSVGLREREDLLDVLEDVGEALGAEGLEGVQHHVDERVLVDLAMALRGAREQFVGTPSVRRIHDQSGRELYRVDVWSVATQSWEPHLGLDADHPLVDEARRRQRERTLALREAVEGVLGFSVYED